MVQIVQSWLEWLIFGLRGINLGLQHGTAFKTEISLSVNAFSAVRILKPLSIVNPKLSRTKISVFREASLQKCFSFPKSCFILIYLAWGAFSEKPFRFFSEKFLAGGVNGRRNLRNKSCVLNFFDAVWAGSFQQKRVTQLLSAHCHLLQIQSSFHFLHDVLLLRGSWSPEVILSPGT